MADVHTKEQRSYNMSRIKGKNTKPEILVRKFLHQQGFRFRIHDRKLPGKPDIVLLKYGVVLNIHGCFWHGHEGCKDFVIPQKDKKWWEEKISRTKERDMVNNLWLKSGGWKVFDIFECEIKTVKQSKKTFNRILMQLNKLTLVDIKQ